MRDNAKNREETERITENGEIMKYYTTTEYFDEATGEPVSREEVQKNYLIIKTVKGNVNRTAEATTIRRIAIVRRSNQLRIEFPNSGQGSN